jgi:hypothetical protein
MILAFVPRTVIAVLFAAILSLAATGQTAAPNTTEWESETLKLRLFYPSDLVKADAEQVMRAGRLNFAGVSGATDQKLGAATRCLHPVLLLKLSPAEASVQLPGITASVLLAELDIDCLNAEHQSTSTTLLNDMAEIVTKVPGMRPTAQPSTYTIGWQKVHMAAAQGQPQTQDQTHDQTQAPSPAPSQLYTMGISTNWHSHLLVWYFTSNNIDTLNRITKTTVRFGRDQAAPLYPLTIGNATP